MTTPDNRPAAGIEIISALSPEVVLDQCAEVAAGTRGTGMQAQKARVRVAARANSHIDLTIGTESTTALRLTAAAEPHPTGSRLECRMTKWKEIQTKFLFVPFGPKTIPGGPLFMIYVRNLGDAVRVIDPSATVTINKPVGWTM